MENKSRHSTRTAITLALILSACTSMPTQPPAPTETPTMVRTVTPTFLPTATASPTAVPLDCDLLDATSPAPSGNQDISAANRKLSRTVNLGEALEFPDGGHWRWLDKDETFYTVRTAGFTAVRIPIDFAVNADTTPPDLVFPFFWTRLDSVINRALDCGLVVIVNMHNYNSESQIPIQQEGDFIALWKEIAEHYQSYPDTVLYFEPFNEPDDPQRWNRVVDKTVSVIRQTNPTRPIIITSAYWSAPDAVAELRLPADTNLIVSFHYYWPLEFTHQCVDFIDGAMGWCGTLWNGTTDEIADIERNFDLVAKWAEKRNRPIFLGEFGSISSADQASRVRWTTAVREAAEERGFSWAYWDLCDTSNDGSLTFGIFDCYEHPLQDSDWRQDMLHALIAVP